MTLKARTPLPPSWACRCTACQVAVSHGAPEIDRDYDALAERADALYAELRDVCVGKTGCIACRVGWLVGEAERHIPGCLAAPSAPKEAA